MIRKLVFLGIVLPFLAQCTTVEKSSDTGLKAQSPDSQSMCRRLAWMEGDIQNDYEPNRTVARERLKRWEGRVPDPSDTADYLNYLAVLDASGETDDAEAKIKDYLTKYPNEKRAVFLLGVHYLRVKKMELANFFLTQLEKDSSFTWKSLLYNNLGMLALKDGNRIAAMSNFERATRESPPIAAPHVNLGALYLKSRNYPAAERAFSAAVSVDDHFEDAVLGLGGALEGQGKFAEAHAAYAGYIENNPDALSALYNDSLVLGNRLDRRSEAAQLMLRYIQNGGKETAEAQRAMENWK